MESIAVQAIIGACAIIVVVIQVRSNERMKRIEVASMDTREQVKNSHGSNLREDIDKAVQQAIEANETAKTALKVADSHTKRLDRISADVGSINTRLSDHLDGR